MLAAKPTTASVFLAGLDGGGGVDAGLVGVGLARVNLAIKGKGGGAERGRREGASHSAFTLLAAGVFWSFHW